MPKELKLKVGMVIQVDPKSSSCLYSNRWMRLGSIRPTVKHLRTDLQPWKRVHQDDPGDIHHNIIRMSTSGIHWQISAKYLASNHSVKQSYTLEDVIPQIEITIK